MIHLRNPGRRIAFTSAALAFAVGLGGCTALDAFSGTLEPARDDDTQEVVEGGQADVFTLEVGDCLNESTGSEVTEVPVVPCSELHDEEIYFEFTLPDGAFPGADAMIAAADEQCAPQFDVFVGMAYADSTLDWYPFTPTEQGWDEGDDRVIQCVVWDPAGQVTGTLAGAAR